MSSAKAAKSARGVHFIHIPLRDLRNFEASTLCVYKRFHQHTGLARRVTISEIVVVLDLRRQTGQW